MVEDTNVPFSQILMLVGLHLRTDDDTGISKFFFSNLKFQNANK